MNESFTRIRDFYRPGASDTFRVRLHEGEDELGTISFKGSDEDVVFAYRDSATNNSNDMTRKLFNEGFSQSAMDSIKSCIVDKVLSTISKPVLDKVPSLEEALDLTKHFSQWIDDQREVREVNESIDMTKYMENHFIGHATIVYSKNRLVSVLRPTEREKLADKIATERMKKEGIPDTEQNRGKWLSITPTNRWNRIENSDGTISFIQEDGNDDNLTNKRIAEEEAGKKADRAAQ